MLTGWESNPRRRFRRRLTVCCLTSRLPANLFLYQRWESNPHALRTLVSKTNAATVTPLWYFAQVEGLEPPPKVLETFMLPLHHTYVVVIPEGFEPPHLLVRSEMFYPIKLRNHFMRKRRESNPQAFYSQLISSQCPRPFGPLPYFG